MPESGLAPAVAAPVGVEVDPIRHLFRFPEESFCLHRHALHMLQSHACRVERKQIGQGFIGIAGVHGFKARSHIDGIRTQPSAEIEQPFSVHT